ncbi:MAG: hypothetical protein WC865_01195 [Bacteroidales bacterium]
MRSHLYVLLAIVMISCTSHPTDNGNRNDVKFYRNLLTSQTPFDMEKGIHPLSARKAKTINSYKFTYDDKGRILSVEYVRNNLLLSYSSMGFAAKITYVYSDNKQNKYYFNYKNEPIEVAGVFRAEYSLDPNGTRTGVTFFGKYGEPVENRNRIHSFRWEVLPDGMVRELRYDLTGKETILNPFCPFYELRFTYNEKGYVTRMANYKADTLYNCTAENCGEVGVSYFLFEPDDQGDVLRFSVFNASGLTSNVYWGWSKRINKFDRNGYLLESVFYDQDGEYIGGKRVPIIRHAYDEHGAETETWNLDKDRKPFNNPENRVCRTVYKYDQFGTRTETLRFDKDGAPVNIRYDLTNCCCF